NTFSILEILYNSLFILSSYIFYLSLMFTNKIFLILKLTLENIYDLDIQPKCNLL
ncbi:hypothetical protein K469DRAFT_566465, partial [Zopfia rhizophila CBS 207.26]